MFSNILAIGDRRARGLYDGPFCGFLLGLGDCPIALLSFYYTMHLQR